MKTKSLFKSVPITILLFILIGFTANYAPGISGTWVTMSRTLSDDAIVDNECDTWTQYGGTAGVRHSTIDYLGIYVDTNGFFDKGKAYISIDGGQGDADPWRLPYTRDWEVYVNWVFQGNYNEEGYNYLKFEYNLYYMSGNSQVSVITHTKTYSSDFDYEDNTDVSHYLGNTGTISSSTDHYLDIYIELYHYDWFHSCDSDLYDTDPGNFLAFDSIDFMFWMDYY